MNIQFIVRVGLRNFLVYFRPNILFWFLPYMRIKPKRKIYDPVMQLMFHFSAKK